MKILVSALEHSANVHLKEVMNALPQTTTYCGIFDDQLGTPTFSHSDLAIMGFKDVISKIPFYLKLMRSMVALADKCDKVLLIDSSGFNLPLTKKIKKRYPKKEIIYYVLPQAWAWKKGRIKTLERTITHLCSILPFEKEFYSAKAPISYVGHPLLDEIKHYKNQCTQKGSIVFMPGSRRSEIKALMPHFKVVANELRQQHESCVLVIPPIYSQEQIKEIYGNISEFSVVHQPHHALLEAKFAFICSGTATLEASLIGTPFVLCYIAKALDYFIATSLIKLQYIGLANILSSYHHHEPMHPELIQERVTSEAMLMHYTSMDKEKFFTNSLALREYLQHGSAQYVANIMLGQS